MMHSYPKELISKSNYKNLIDIGDIPFETFLLRKSFNPSKTKDNMSTEKSIRVDELFPIRNKQDKIEVDNIELVKDGQDKGESISYDLRDFYRFSVCLLGIFTPNHFKYNVKGVGSREEWNKSLEELNRDEIEYSLDKNCACIFIHSKIHTSKIPYQKEGKMMKGIIYVDHKPTRVNYWHFQFRFVEEGRPDPISHNKPGSDVYKDLVSSIVKTHFKELAFRQEPSYKKITKSFFSC